MVIVISKSLDRRSKAKRRSPAYSRALRLIKIVVQGKLRSDFQRGRGDSSYSKAGVI